jgi:hypothetical protein
MILVLQVVVAVVGLLVLIFGRLRLSKSRCVKGLAARIAGLFLLLPIPLVLLAVWIAGVSVRSEGLVFPENLGWTGITVDLPILALCVLEALLIAFEWGNPDRDVSWVSVDPVGAQAIGLLPSYGEYTGERAGRRLSAANDDGSRRESERNVPFAEPRDETPSPLQRAASRWRVVTCVLLIPLAIAATVGLSALLLISSSNESSSPLVPVVEDPTGQMAPYGRSPQLPRPDWRKR